MRVIVAVIVVWASAFVPWAATAQAPKAREASSRFAFHRGHWWYRLPSKRWAVYHDGRWVAPLAQGSPQDDPLAQPQTHRNASFASSNPDMPATTGNARSPLVDKRSEDGPTLERLDREVRQMRKALERLEQQVQHQGETQAVLVRGQNDVIAKLLKRSEDAAKHAEQVRKNRVGID